MHACTSVVRILACGYRSGLQLLVRQLEVLVCISRQLVALGHLKLDAVRRFVDRLGARALPRLYI